MPPTWSRGYVHVYTGNGKGKTTAALGLAVRAAGHGLRTYIGQFLKAGNSGEHRALAKLSDLITIEAFGTGRFHQPGKALNPAEVKRAQKGLARAREAMLSGDYRIVVLDEVNVALHFGLVSVRDVMDFIRAKPEAVELVLTGYGAPPAIIDAGDLVSVSRAVKHYFDKGVKARMGIEK